MDHNGSVSGPPLYHQHLLNDVNDGTGGGAQTLRGPAGHLELGHLVHLARLQDQRQKGGTFWSVSALQLSIVLACTDHLQYILHADKESSRYA